VTGFFRELRRRKVIRMAGFYIVGAWLIMQAADVFFPGWGLPDAAINVLLIAAVVGFPLALVFGWFYDVTTHGIVRTPAADDVDTGKTIPLQRTDYLILAALAGIAVFIVSRAGIEIAETPRGEAAGMPAGSVGEAPPLEILPNSIAVLPFTNISSDPENEIFCDGISEEILNKLGAFSDLHVIARTSSFSFKDSDYAVPRISALLGVRYLLQGSVRKAGDRLRISARLVDDTGEQQWTETYDRELTDIFAVQTEIADMVASMVAPQISHQTAQRYEPDVDAYQSFLSGRELVYKRDTRAAVDELAVALRLDPDFADAHAELAIALLIGAPGEADLRQAREAIDTALQLRPGLPRALAARGLLLQQQRSPDWSGAEAVLRMALEKDPNMVDAMNWLSITLAAEGVEQERKALMERAAQLDPLHPVIVANLASLYWEEGELNRAEQTMIRLTEVPHPGRAPFIYLRDLYLATGQLVKMNAIEKRLALLGLHVYYGLALNYAVLGLWDEAAYWNARWQRDFPDFLFTGYAEMNLPAWQGRYDDAVRAFQDALEERGANLSELERTFSLYLGRYQALAGDHVGAVATLAPVLPETINTRRLDDEVIDGYHALAWSYLQLGEPDKAQALLSQFDEFFRDAEEKQLSQRNPNLYLFAQNTLLVGNVDLALDRFEKAIDAGWREFYTKRHDPRWAALKNDPRYEALMAKVRGDVDRQRAEVEQMDAAEDFPALLDSVQASRQ
jgi:TolB-like protein/Flp pilus assembly protein TadD